MTRQIINNNINERYWKQKTNPIIRGYFPQYKTYKEQAITRVNKTLSILLLITVGVCLLSYYLVTSSEVKLNNLRKETIAITERNVDLQNDLDSIRSYQNVDKTMKSKNFNKAEKVLEVPAVNTPDVNLKSQEASRTLKWSIGY